MRQRALIILRLALLRATFLGVALLGVSALAFPVYALGFDENPVVFPKSDNLYRDIHNCHFFGRADGNGGISLSRLCPDSYPIALGDFDLGGSRLSLASADAVIHFFVDSEYPLWLKEADSSPVPLHPGDGIPDAVFMALAQQLDPVESEYYQILMQWQKRGVGFAGALLKGVKYGAIDFALSVPLAGVDVFNNIKYAVKMNRYMAQQGHKHISGLTGWISCLADRDIWLSPELWADWIVNRGLIVLAEELIFRLGLQNINGYLADAVLPGRENWPARAHLISMLARSSSSLLFGLWHLPIGARGIAVTYIVIASYFINSVVYERYGLGAAIVSHGVFNSALDVYKQGLLAMMKNLVNTSNIHP